MADVDFGDKELFEQIEDSVPQVPKHIIFEDDEETEEVQQLRNRLEECEECMQRLTEENILLFVCCSIAATASASWWFVSNLSRSLIETEVWRCSIC